MKTTANFKLKKPNFTDVADIETINANMDVIDSKLKLFESGISGKANASHKHNTTDINDLTPTIQQTKVNNAINADKVKNRDLCSEVDSLKQSVVNGKQTIINGINSAIGYGSGLNTNHTFNDLDWWIQNKVKGTINPSQIKTLYLGHGSVYDGWASVNNEISHLSNYYSRYKWIRLLTNIHLLSAYYKRTDSIKYAGTIDAYRDRNNDYEDNDYFNYGEIKPIAYDNSVHSNAPYYVYINNNLYITPSTIDGSSINHRSSKYFDTDFVSIQYIQN